MDSAVGHLPPVHPGLCVQVVFELAVYVVDDWLPASTHKRGLAMSKQGRTSEGTKEPGELRTPRCLPVAVVDSVSKARGVDYCEQQLDAPLLY